MLDKCDQRRGGVGYWVSFFPLEIAVDRLTSAKMEKGQRTDNPDVATHRKPKKAVMIVELL